MPLVKRFSCLAFTPTVLRNELVWSSLIFRLACELYSWNTLHPESTVGQFGVGRNRQVRLQWDVVADSALEADFLALRLTASCVSQ